MKPTRSTTLDVDKHADEVDTLGAEDPAIAEALAQYIKHFGEPSSTSALEEAFGYAKKIACGFYVVEPDRATFRRLGFSLLKAKVERDGERPRYVAAPGPVPVVLYLRCSSKDQRDRSATLEEQLKEVVDKLRERGCVVVAVFWDDDTGTNYDRPGLHAVRAYAKRHLAQGVAVWITNRFGRQAVDGQTVGRELSWEGCPVLYRRRPLSRFRVADSDDLDEFKEFADQLYDAEADLHEHKDKIERGQRGALRRGEWPHGNFRHSIFYEGRKEGKGRDRRTRVCTRPKAQDAMASILAFLDQEASQATLQAIADTFGIRLPKLVAELQSRFIKGILDTPNLRLDDNFHENLQLVTEEEYERLQKCLLPAQAHLRKKAELSLRGALEVASLTEIHVVTKERFLLECRCGQYCKPELNGGDDAFDREVWRCPDGHKNLVVPNYVRHGLALDNKVFCPACGRYEYMRRNGVIVVDNERYVRARCLHCHAQILCTHELEVFRRRHLKETNAARGRDATKADGQLVLEFFEPKTQ